MMLHTTAIFAALSACAQLAYADPTGGTVTSGGASISSSANTTTITQSTDRAIIRWNTFDVSGSEHVQFLQPSSSSITVNRIRDTKASQIDGKITANGNIVLINPNGLVFGSSAVVDVGGLVATSSDLDDDNAFMSGGAVKFTKPGQHDAKIINNGSMTVREGGLIGLVAPNVENNGIIQAKLGKVQLASGDIHTIDFAGDGLIKLEISDNVYAQSVKNTGTIMADGGQILLTAAAARGLVDTLVTNTGTLRANTVTLADGTQRVGSIVLSTMGLNLFVPPNVTYTENTKAQIVNTGRISANGALYDQIAGSITVLADLITIGDGSVVEATGDIGGGDISIGGDYQGGNGVPTSDMIYISDQAILNASARRRGDGGRIILWSDENTRFYGHADASGGLDSGNGGLIEISGKQFLDFDGTIDLLAAHGNSGTLLLDPTNITISSGANAFVNGSSPFAPNADDAVSVLNITTLTTALASGNVIVQTRATGAQAGTITVSSAITWSSGNTLTLDAHSDIIVNQAISAGTGSITMISGGDVQLNANISGMGTLTIQQANNTQTMGIAGGAGTLNLAVTDLNRLVDGWGNILLGRTSSTVLMTVNARTWTDNLTLRNGTGTITVAGSQAMGANTLTLSSSGGIVTLGGATGTGNITATTGGGNMTVNGAISTTGAVNFNTGGGTFSNSSTMGTGALTLATVNGALTIGAATTATGTTSLNSGAAAMNINAALNSGTNALSLTTTGTNITTSAAGVITSGALTIATSGGNLSTSGAVTASGVTSVTTGAGTIGLGAAFSSTTNSMTLTTTAAAITTAAITSAALTVNSGGANISLGAITASGNGSVTSGNGTIALTGTANFGANTLTLTTTGFGITTAAITSGALSMTSGGATITTNNNIAASGTTTLNSGGGAINVNAALGSGTGTLNLTTGGGALTTLTGAITSGAFNISTSGGNVVIGGIVTATGIGSILTGTGTVQTIAISTGTNALGITTAARTITTGNLTSGALTLASAGAAISTGSLTFSGTSSVNAGAGTINIGNVTGGTNALTLTNTGVNNITTAAITSGNLSMTSGGGIVTTNGAVAAAGTLGITSGGGAININNVFSSTGTMTLTSAGGTFTKGNTGLMSAAALTVTTTNGNFSVGTGGLTTTGTASITTGTGSATVGSTWTATGQAIGITTTNNSINLTAVTSAALTLNSNGGTILFGGGVTASGIITANSLGGIININGALSSGANAINITSGGGAISKAANITTTTGAVSLTSGGGNITIGTGGITTTTGTVTLNSGAAGVITVNTVINVNGAGALNIVTDTNIFLNIANALTSAGGTLTVTQFTASKIIGIGAAAAGDILFDAGEYAMIKDGWGSLIFGSLTATGGINVTVTAWTDSVTFRSLTGVINLANAMSFGAANNLTISTDADINLGGLLTGTATGTLTITPTSNATGIGIGSGQAGAIAFTDTEKGYLHTAWSSIVIGSTTMTGDVNMNATTWLDPVTFRTNTGVINVNGAQVMTANNGLVFNTNADLNLASNISGSGTGALTISTVASSATTMGFGDTMVGTLNMTNLELSRIQFGWASITLGSTTAAGAINVGAYTWDDHLTVASASGAVTIGATSMTTNNNFAVTSTTGPISITSVNTLGTGTISVTSTSGAITTGTMTSVSGAQAYSTSGAVTIAGVTTTTGAATVTSTAGIVTLNGATLGTGGNLTINANNSLVLGGNINGTATGTLTISSTVAAATFGIGDGEVGAVNLTNAELALIQSNWGNLIFGSTAITGAMNVGAYTWNNAVSFRTFTGLMTIDGLTMAGALAASIMTDSAIVVNGAISGTGALTIRAAVNATMGLNDTGTVNLSTAELAFIQNNWSSVTFGHNALSVAGTINVGAMTWANNITFLSNLAVINVNGQQTMGTKDLTFTTNADIAINAGLAGTANLIIQSQAAATTIGVGTGQTGLIQLSNSDLGNVLNGWNSIAIGNVAQTGAMNIGAYTWQYDTVFRTLTGVITISGDQTTGRNLTYETNNNLVLNANLIGTGTLTIRNSTTAGLITTGGAVGAATLVIDTTELGKITDGWSQLVFGRVDGAGVFTANTATWNDNVKLITGGGIMTIAGVQTALTNNLTIAANSNVVVSAALTGSGNLAFEGALTSTSIGVAGGAGTLGLSAAEINLITDGWASQTYGSVTGTGIVTVGAYLWKDNATFISNGNIAVTGAQGSNASTNLVYASLAGNFVNTGGAAVFGTVGAGGRYLIYSTSAGTDTYGGLVAPTAINAQTYFSQAPGTIGAGLNRIIYSSGAAKILYLQIDDKSKIYGDTLPTFTYTYLGGLQGGDTIGTALTSITLSATGAVATDSVGTMTAITGVFGTALGYTTSVINGTLSVTKAPILITTSNASQTYGDANPGATINYIGLRNGETSGVIDTLATAGSGTDNFSGVNTYAINVSGAIDNNYTFNYSAGTLTINKAVLTATTQNATREFGLANPAMSIVYTGFKNGENDTVINTAATASSAAIATSAVNTYAITGAGGLDDNYSFTFANTGLLSVTKATLTGTTQNATREYGLANPTFTIVYTGYRNADTVAVVTTAATLTAGTILTSNVGDYAVTASGANATNYQFVYANDGILSITKATLTATSQNATREYGAADPTFTFNYTGFRNSETSAVIDLLATATPSSTIASNVGTSYTISGSAASDNNYTFAYVDSGLLSITKAMLTATTQNATREYGLANPALTVAYTGFRNGDDEFDLTTGATATTGANIFSDVNNYSITSSGATASNYSFTYANTGVLSITKATLNVTGQNATREYGLANPALSVTYSGFRNGDDELDLDSLATAGTTALIGSDVGSYNVTGTGGLDNNYAYNYIAGTLSVTKATLTATTQNATREYGLANPAMSIVYTGFRNGDDETDLTTAATASSAATLTSGVNSYAITGTVGVATNYSFNYVNTGLLSVTKAMLTATTQNATREYGLANPTLSAVYTGFRNGDTETDLTTLATVSTAATILSDVGSYGIGASGALDDNYAFTYANTGNLSITKATLTATSQNATREYGLANPTLNVVYTGFRNTDTQTDINTLATAATGATIGSDVGTYGISSSGASDNNYQFTYANTGNLSVTKATLTATTQNATRQYGLTNPTLTVVYTGFRNGDDSTDLTTLATAATAATILSDVGTYGITSSGALATNYNFTYADTGNLSVTKAMLTATTQNATREYGLANPTMSIVYTGFRNGDDDTDINTLGTASSAATLTSNVGSYAVTGTGATDNNYDFTYANTGNLSVTKATLTATTQNANREYGLANPTLTVVYTGFRNGDDETDIGTLATAVTAATILSDVGTYGITSSGAVDGNYQFTYANTGNLSVTKATLTATTQNATRQYGLANPTLTVVYTGFRNGDDSTDLTTLATAATAATLTSNVGTYGITSSGATDNNYQFTYADTGNLSITKAMLTATSQNATREYGLANPTLNIAYTGFRNGDDSTDLTTLATAATAATILSDVGTYAITGSGAVDDNYDFTYADTGNLGITKATLTATTQNATREYGLANPTLNVVYTGFRNGDDDTDIGTLATAATAATIASNVGTYGITSSGAVDNNYAFTYANTGNLSVTKATLTATTQNATRQYGLTNPALTIAYTGFRNGDDSTDLTTLATAATAATILSNVGTYGITGSGAVDDNYQFTYADTGNLSITKAMLTATTQNATREYGLANPALNIAYTGFRNGDDSTDLTTLATAATAATILSNVGGYGITGSGATDDNYDFTYANTGNLSITKATLTATTQNATREYGLANAPFSIVYTGFRNGDTDGEINTLANASTAATIGSNVGTYTITASGASDNNYQFTYANTGDITITKATLTATTQNATRQYGLNNPSLNVAYAGFRNGDDSSDINTLATAATAATILSNVGTYGITSSGATDNNYQFTYTNTGNLNITKATVTVTADDKYREVGEPDPALTATYTGFRNGENSGVINTLATLSTTATGGSPVGDYVISGSGAADNNYQFSYVNGVFSVVLDSSVPPPDPTPAPAPTPSALPSTVYFSVTNPYVLSYTPFTYNDGEERPAFIRKPHIVFIADDDIFNSTADDYLIAFSESLRREYYGLTYGKTGESQTGY